MDWTLHTDREALKYYNEYIHAIAEEIKELGEQSDHDLEEIIHEYVDGSEYVIYPWKAMKIVCNVLECFEIDEADGALIEMDTEFVDIWEHCIRIVYQNLVDKIRFKVVD